MTFSIVARDPNTGALGSAVSTQRLAVGNRVQYAEYGVGAIVTQANTNMMLARQALQLLRDGADATTALETVLGNDPDREERQLAIIDARGNQAAFTGTITDDYKNVIFGPNCIAVGDILVGSETLECMMAAFQSKVGTLGDKVMTAMEAAQLAGGDKRGRTSAAIMIVNEPPSVDCYQRNIDLRVDKSPDPVADLRVLFDEYTAYFKIK